MGSLAFFLRKLFVGQVLSLLVLFLELFILDKVSPQIQELCLVWVCILVGFTILKLISLI